MDQERFRSKIRVYTNIDKHMLIIKVQVIYN